MNEYKTILESVEAEVIDKKSKFIANMYEITNSDEAEEKIKEIKKKYYDARHNCVAYRVIENNQLIEKSNDDGEPSGTAGEPMLNILQKNNICNVLIVVTRYFGGVLLGTGGLIRAYSEATQKAIEEAVFVAKVEGVEAKVVLEYSNLDIFKYYCKKMKIQIKDIQYSENIVLTIEMEKNRKNIFLKDIETKNIKVLKYEQIQEKYIEEIVE